MSLAWSDVPAPVRATLARGVVIPAHPLALDAGRRLDTERQRALSRYYIDAGAGGLAVGVHTTQFAIREAGLYEPVLKLAAETADAWTDRPLVRIAGLVGRTEQALAEADVALALGYHAGMVSLAAFAGASEDERLRALRYARPPAFRWWVSTCSRRSAASCLAPPSGAASRRWRTWSRSRSRPSTATVPSTFCAASSRPAPRNA